MPMVEESSLATSKMYNFFRIGTIVHTVAKYSCVHHGTAVDVYMYGFCFKTKAIGRAGYAEFVFFISST